MRSVCFYWASRKLHKINFVIQIINAAEIKVINHPVWVKFRETDCFLTYTFCVYCSKRLLVNSSNMDRYTNAEMTDKHFIYIPNICRSLDLSRSILANGLLSPPEFLLWGHLKSLIYFIPVENMEDLRNRIITGCNTKKPTPVYWKGFGSQRILDSCILAGNYFEQFL